MGPNPENSLTGTIFTVNAWRHDALEVTTSRGVFRGGAKGRCPCSSPPPEFEKRGKRSKKIRYEEKQKYVQKFNIFSKL